MKIIVIWSLIAVGSAVLAAVLAVIKNRDYSFWAAWSFLLPPVVLILALMPRHRGPTPRQRTLDEEDAATDNH
jgi:hypothetical protein